MDGRRQKRGERVTRFWQRIDKAASNIQHPASAALLVHLGSPPTRPLLVPFYFNLNIIDVEARTPRTTNKHDKKKNYSRSSSGHVKLKCARRDTNSLSPLSSLRLPLSWHKYLWDAREIPKHVPNIGRGCRRQGVDGSHIRPHPRGNNRHQSLTLPLLALQMHDYACHQ